MAAVAESPVFAAGSIVAQENSSEVGSLLEDQDIYLELPAAATILQDLDGSETLASVRIGGLNDIGGLGLVGSLVDETGTLVGVSDGAGTTTLTAAQYAGEVYFRPPTDYNGTVDLTVVAVSQEPSSGSTATSDTYALNFSLDPVSREASADVQNVSLLEYTNSTTDDTHSEYLTLYDNNPSYERPALSNISISVADATNVDKALVSLSFTDDSGGALSSYFSLFLEDGSALETSNGTVRIYEGLLNTSDDISSLTQLNPSNGVYAYTGNEFTIYADSTTSDGNAVDLITTELAKLFVRPPEDFSGDVSVSTIIRTGETGASLSPAVEDSFSASVVARSESPVFADGFYCSAGEFKRGRLVIRGSGYLSRASCCCDYSSGFRW